jgi:hypothetical protein
MPTLPARRGATVAGQTGIGHQALLVTFVRVAAAVDIGGVTKGAGQIASRRHVLGEQMITTTPSVR